VNEKSGGNLKGGVPNQKCAENPAQVCVIDSELFAYLDTGNRYIRSVEIRDCA
jgi:hypothetical protein